MKTDLSAILAQAVFFRGLAPTSREALAAIAIPRSVPREELLFREGESGHSIYLLARGRVELTRSTASGDPIVMTVVAPGQVFAEIVLFESDRFPVTARTLTECHLYLFPRREVLALLAKESFRNDFLAMLFARQRHLTERLLQAASPSLEERFFTFLQEQYGEDNPARVDIPKRSIAAAIGTTPESLSRLLRRLRDQGRLVWTGPWLRRTETGRDRIRPS